jgi:hypothetical protein
MGQPTVDWVQWIDGESSEEGNAIATDLSGNIYVTGYSGGGFTIGDVSYNKPSGGNGAFVVKYDTSGVVKWVQWIDGASNEYGNGITTDSFGNIYVTGISSSSGEFTIGGVFIGDVSYTKPSGGNGAFVVKYDTSGVVKWVQWIDGASNEYGNGIATDSSGNIYVTGYSNTTSGGIFIGDISYTKPSAGSGAFVIKYDTSGIVQWVQWIDGGSSEEGYGIATDSFGNIYVTGHSITTSGRIFIGDLSYNKPSALWGDFVVKYDTSGNVKWVQWIDGNSSEYGYGIATDLSGNIYVTGSSNTSGGIFIGDVSHNKPSTNAGAFVVKYDTSGAVQWVQWIDGGSTEQGYGITTDSFGNIYVTGSSNTTSGGIFIGDLSYNKPSASFGAFVVKYDTSGAVQWVQWIDGDSLENGNGITTDSFGNIYVTGYSNTSGGIRIGDVSHNKPYAGWGAFVVKYVNPAPAPEPAPAPAGTKVSILLPIQVDFNQFGDITVRVEGEDVSYNYDLRLHYYSKSTDTKAVDLCNNVFKYNESTVSDALTDVSCSAPTTLKGLIKTALDASDLSCAVPRKVYGLSGDMAMKPDMSDNSGTLLTTRPALMKDYLRGWLYTYLYDIIGLAATTGSIELDMSGFSEYISENLKTQLCDGGATGAAVREFIFKAMFVQDPARFQNASGASTAPDFSGQTLANKDLLRGMPFKAGDSLSFLIKFNFPKGNIKAPVQSTVLRLGTTTNGITVGDQTNITVSTMSLSNTIAPGDLFRDFRQCLVWLQVHIEH